MGYIISKPEILDSLTSMMHTGIGMNLLVKFVLCDSSDDGHDIVQWLRDNKTIRKIIMKLDPKENESVCNRYGDGGDNIRHIISRQNALFR